MGMSNGDCGSWMQVMTSFKYFILRGVSPAVVDRLMTVWTEYLFDRADD